MAMFQIVNRKNQKIQLFTGGPVPLTIKALKSVLVEGDVANSEQMKRHLAAGLIDIHPAPQAKATHKAAEPKAVEEQAEEPQAAEPQATAATEEKVEDGGAHASSKKSPKSKSGQKKKR